jgi:hypothetical protein
MTTPPSIVVYPQGAARCVIDLDELNKMLTPDKRDYLLRLMLDDLIAETKAIADEIERREN